MTPKEWERFEVTLAAWKFGTVEEDVFTFYSVPNGCRTEH